MARKYDLISELYNRTCKTVVSSPQSWQAFLSSACRNYKLRFDEQLLVFAQRPDATAVLEIERWNGTFGRWVNKGATGIAVFDDVSRSRQRLIHYFDISDTHESRYSRPVPIWTMKPEYEEEIIETLESTFGAIEDKSSLASAIMCAARNATEDNIPDYVGDLLYTIDNSFLEDLNEDMIASLYRKTVTNSVAYMMMERLGIDTEEHFFREDFEDIINFNTPETLNALGFATSDIAEMGLAEIAKTVMSLEKQNRIIAENQNSDYNKVKENQTERSLENDRTDLHDAGRLQTAQSDLEQPEVPMGRFAQLRAKYLKENRKVLYYNLLTSCKLNEHLTEVEQTATELTERLTKELADKEGVTEMLKATDMMSWVRQMNNIRSRVQETVLKQVVHA